MNAQEKISRAKFIALVGGMALTAVLFKFAGAKELLSAGTTQKTAAGASTAYGHGPYGGRHA
jgi:hypothetical protein